MKRAAMIILPMLALGACASPPNPQQPEVGVEVPQNWTARSLDEGEIADDWWKGFGDSNLDALIEEALASNPSLREAESRIEAAMAAMRTTRAGSMPNVSAGFDAGRSQDQRDFGAPGGLTELNTQRYGASLNLQWEVDLWGRVRAQTDAAWADAQATRAQFYGARLSLIAQVTKSYFAVTEAWRQLRIAEQNESSAVELSERVEERYRAGLRTALDYRLALADVAVAESNAEQRRRTYARLKRQLEVLLGRYPGALIETREDLSLDVPPAPAGLPVQLLTRRPDIVEAERRVAAADQRVRSAYLDLLPRISLTGSTGLASNDVSDLVDGKFFVWNLLGNLLAPLFDGGRRWAEIDRTQAVEEGALAVYALTALNAFAEVENALSDEDSLRRQLASLDESVSESEAALQISEERYYRGVLDITRVLETRRQFYNALSARAAVRAALLTTRVDLFAALGGAFDATDAYEADDAEEDA